MKIILFFVFINYLNLQQKNQPINRWAEYFTFILGSTDVMKREREKAVSINKLASIEPFSTELSHLKIIHSLKFI